MTWEPHWQTEHMRQEESKSRLPSNSNTSTASLLIGMLVLFMLQLFAELHRRISARHALELCRSELLHTRVEIAAIRAEILANRLEIVDRRSNVITIRETAAIAAPATLTASRTAITATLLEIQDDVLEQARWLQIEYRRLEGFLRGARQVETLADTQAGMARDVAAVRREKVLAVREAVKTKSEKDALIGEEEAMMREMRLFNGGQLSLPDQVRLALDAV